MDLHSGESHLALDLAGQHFAPLAPVLRDLQVDPVQRARQARPPQPTRDGMGLHLGQFFLGQRGQFARTAASFVPAFHHGVDHRALPGGGRFRIQPVLAPQAQDRTGIELIGIAAQPVDRGHGQGHVALLGTGARLGPGIGRRGRGMVNGAGERDRLRLAVAFGQFAQHRLNPQDEAAGDDRPALAALRPAEHDLRRAQRSGQVMRGEADAEFARRHAQRAQHRRRQAGFGARRGGPGALDQTGADHQVGAAHPRFEQAIDRNAGMAAPRRAHRNPVHRVAQHAGQILDGKARSGLIRRAAQFLQPGRERAPVRLGP